MSFGSKGAVSFLGGFHAKGVPSAQTLDATLTALAALGGTAGVLEVLGQDSFTARLIGVANATDLLTRAGGDGRYGVVGRQSQPRLLANPMAATTGAGVALGTSAAKAQFLGYAYRDFTSADSFTMIWRQTAAGSGFTFGECALATGPIVPGAAPTLTIVGYVDATTQFALGTGNTATAVIPVANGQTIAAGAAIWGVMAKQSTGSPSMNSTLAEPNASGILATLSTANWRPSSNVGSAVAWAVETTSTQHPRFIVVGP